MTRRTVVNSTAGFLAQALAARGQQPADVLPGSEKKRKLKIVFVGAHVDDWGDCAGTLARYSGEGHDVTCFSFTPGDSESMAISHRMSVDKLASLRRDDAIRGTKIIGAHLKILNQRNQNMHVDPAVYDEFNKTLAAENPDVVFGMWPLEFHPDHRAAANIAFNAWLASGMKFEFFFCETPEAAEMTPQQFAPNRFVDIEPVMDLKRKSVVANTFIKDWWPECEMWAKFRGGEYGCQYAEAFVRIATVASMKPANIAPRRWYGGGVQITHDK
jgi:LmbE family N-acetylglucosaminyl deacetylase